MKLTEQEIANIVNIYCYKDPITKKAKELDEKRTINAELVLLLTMLKEANDEKTLKILEKYIKLLSKEK